MSRKVSITIYQGQVIWYSEAISWLQHKMEFKLEKVIRICRGTDRTGMK